MKQKKMIYLIVILFILTAIYAGLKYWNHYTQEKEEKEEEAQKIRIVDTEKLSAFSYTDGELQMNFVKEDGNWYDESDKGIRLSQDAVETIEKTITKLTAVRELKNPDAMKDYGLEEPSYTIWFTPEEDAQHVLYVGNVSGDNYYATTDDTGKVYTISADLITRLQFDLASLVENDTIPSIGSGNLQKVEVTQNGETVTFTEEDDIAQLAGGWGIITLTDCVDYNVKEENFANYGLEETERVVAKAIYKDSATEEQKTCTIYIGKPDDTGSNRYVLVEGSNMVYVVGSSIIDNMITVSEVEKGE
ncbi:MAG: DUF4340 domain-containing protein [Dorea sp.]